MGRLTARIGLAGCGAWGSLVLRDLVSLGCEVHVAAPGETSREAARRAGARSVVPAVEDLPAVEGVVVVTPTTTHAEVVEGVLARGVPIFCEKPLTADLADAERLATRAADRLFVMDKWRYHPGIEALAALARSGELGPVIGLRTTRVGWTNTQPDIDTAWHLAPHDLSIALEVLGHLPVPRAAVAEREEGRITGMTAVLGGRPWFTFEVSSRRRRSFREARLFGGDAVAVLPDSYADHVVIQKAGPGAASPPELTKRPVSSELPLLRELRAFVEHVRGGPPPRSSVAEALAVVRTIAELRRMASRADPGEP